MESEARVGSDKKWDKKRASGIVPSLTSPHIQSHKESFPALVKPRALPAYNTAGAPRQRNMAQMKEQIRTPEKELSDKEIDNLRCRVQNTDDQGALRND